MKIWAENKYFIRFLEILPGLSAWIFIVSPFVVAFIAPIWVASFILIYSFYWLLKTVNIARHLIAGYLRLKRNMKVDWLDMTKRTSSLKSLKVFLEERYQRTKSLYDYEELLYIQNLKCHQNRIKKWQDITHVVIIAVSNEGYDIINPTLEGLIKSNYPKDKIIVVFAAESRFEKSFLKSWRRIEKKYKDKFFDLKYYLHVDAPGEVIGKGPNITNAGRGFWKDYKGKLNTKNVLVTNLDADHIVHPEYFGRLTYVYVVDPNRDRKSYQPVALLFNNIWDVPALNRIGAVSDSFWQVVEGMRSYRLRTFAAHSQSLQVLLLTDFWSVNTIVEDGHQYWRTYFALNGDHAMVALYIPVYQDAVMGESWWKSIKYQYKQKRRWAWGVSDFPYLVVNSIKHKEISLFDRLLQIFRLFTGLFTWSTSSFILATAWIPLYFNSNFQDTVLAHNIAYYSSRMLRLAWIGIIANVWLSMALFPQRPKNYGALRTFSMIIQWLLSPIFAIFLSALPAIESQTRLMLGKKMEVFWITPKVRAVPKKR